VLSVRELWEDERRRRIAKGLDPTPDLPRIASASKRGKGEGWVSEARNWEALEERIRKEQGKTEPTKSTAWESWVMTTFESVQALWPEPFKTWRPAGWDPSAKSVSSSGNETNPFNRPSSDEQKKAGEVAQVDEEWLKGVSQNDLNLDENAAFGDDDEGWERWHHESQGANIESVFALSFGGACVTLVTGRKT
jgi:DNA polymerase zeta